MRTVASLTAAAVLIASTASAKVCSESLPYGAAAPCCQGPPCQPGSDPPPCALSPPPASLHGELTPLPYHPSGQPGGWLLANATHYGGSIRLDANALALTDLDIEGDRMVASWWAGLVVWRLSAAGATAPLRLATIDAYGGAFPSWLPPLSEVDQVFAAVAIPDGDPSFAVLAGIQPGGVAIVDLGTVAQLQTTLRYQDAEQQVNGTIWGASIGGRSYAWVGTASGVVGYDLTRTRDLQCLRTCVGGTCEAAGSPCAGVRFGAFGGPTQYIGGVVTSAGRALLVRSSGAYFPKAAELWDVSVPTAPALVATVTGQAFGAAAWQHGDAAGTIYVALRRPTEVRVYRLAGASLVDTGESAPVYYPSETANYLPLSHSWSTTASGKRVPFVFAGHADGCKYPSEPPQGYEALIRLADPHHPEVLDVADVSPRHLVPLTSVGITRQVDYWSFHAPNQGWGWSSVWPRVAKFYGDVLFRAAHTIGDAHRWTPAPPSGPELIFADGFESGSTSAWSSP